MQPKKKKPNQREVEWKADREEREEGEIDGGLEVRSAVTGEGETVSEIGEIECGWAILTAVWLRLAVVALEGERDWEESVIGIEVRAGIGEREEKRKSEERGERKENKKNY